MNQTDHKWFCFIYEKDDDDGGGGRQTDRSIDR